MATLESKNVRKTYKDYEIISHNGLWVLWALNKQMYNKYLFIENKVGLLLK